MSRTCNAVRSQARSFAVDPVAQRVEPDRSACFLAWIRRVSRSPRMAASYTVDRGSGSILFQVSEVADLDGTVRKARNDLQLPAHRLDMAAQRRDVHIGAPLELRDRGLLYVQGLCQHFLR